MVRSGFYQIADWSYQGCCRLLLCFKSLALHHKILPPTIKVDKPNSKLEIEKSPFYLNTMARPWIQAPGRTRKASVSAFWLWWQQFSRNS